MGSYYYATAKADVLTLAALHSVRNLRIAEEILETIEYVRP